ncbi:hypothetical protein [Mycobacterium sp. SMC-4]|uniref:hypothetical protein n=1 Tax=Mycobacterium sp. SMC-4 TaxID=2857059 RepID=UPI0021B2FCE1|nr:hypothetical protein [Mycobacterium sp. SMC-4]UXA19158.1 hypothetical protein KXD98_05830 [Mycobacterium sp. SMC-4]
MTTKHLGAAVIDLQAHAARRASQRRSRFEEAMRRHPSYLARVATSGDDSVDAG